MTTPERLHRRRCLGLRVGMFFGILLIVFDWGEWPIVGVAAGATLVALGAYMRDCRKGVRKAAQNGTDLSDS
jgi:uncharacterized membrane protein